MDRAPEEKRPRRSIQRLAESIRSLLGFKAQLTSSWAESVCHIINQLPSDEQSAGAWEGDGQSLRIMAHDKDTEVDGKISRVQDDLANLKAQLDQLNLWRGKALNDFLDLKGNIRVFCRIRPLLPSETSGNSVPVVALDSSTVLLKFAENKKQFKFDKVFHPGSLQDEVFSEVEPVIKSALDGFNACICAYGQTGTGKSFTMEGRADCPGIIPRAIESLFKQAVDRSHAFIFTFSMLEIYMGSLRDLLVPQNSKRTDPVVQHLPIKMDPNGGIEIDNLVAIRVSDFNQAKQMHRLGSRLRSTASTNSNATSSRSHCLIRISITCFDARERRRETNKIWMVDLGGSERLLKTQARGRRLEEGKAINLSLSALGDVISALQRKKTHVPYRNSKLTQVLRDSLGEDSKTIMLVHVSPKEEDLCESVCSLSFATRVRSIHLGIEESAEAKAQKEVEMAELLQKIKHLESSCRDVRKEIEKLNTKLRLLLPAETLSTGYMEVPHPSHEQLKSNIERNKQSMGFAAGASSSLMPRFMRPTASSRQKTGLYYHSVGSAKKKVLPPTRRRKASSVRAESMTFTRNRSQSECESDVAVSISKYSAYTESECSQSASECDVKTTTFPKLQRSASSSVCSVTFQAEESIGENNNKWEDKQGLNKHLTVDDWLHLQKQEPTTTNVHQRKHLLTIPLPGKRSRAIKQNSETTIKKIPTSYHASTEAMDSFHEKRNVDGFAAKERSKQDVKDETWNCFEKSQIEVHEAGSVCSSRDTSEKSKFAEERKVEPSEASENDVANQAGQTDASICNGSVKRESDDNRDFCASPSQHMEDAMMPCLQSMRYESALFPNKDFPTAKAAEKNFVSQAIGFLDTKENKGKCHRFLQAVEMVHASAVLGLGIRSIGLEQEFFQGLML